MAVDEDVGVVAVGLLAVDVAVAVGVLGAGAGGSRGGKGTRGEADHRAGCEGESYEKTLVLLHVERNLRLSDSGVITMPHSGEACQHCSRRYQDETSSRVGVE